MPGAGNGRTQGGSAAELRSAVLRRLPEFLHPAVEAGLSLAALRTGEGLPLSPGASRGIVATGLLMVDEGDGAGGQRPVQLVGPGDPYGASVGPADRLVALNPAAILMFDMQRLTPLLTESSELMAFLAAAEREETRRAEDRILMLGARKITTRLAALVLHQWRRAGGASSIDLPLPRAALAAYLGARIETLSRAVTELRSEGCLRFQDRGRIEVVDPERLADLAGMDPAQADPRDWMTL